MDAFFNPIPLFPIIFILVILFAVFYIPKFMKKIIDTECEKEILKARLAAYQNIGWQSATSIPAYDSAKEDMILEKLKDLSKILKCEPNPMEEYKNTAAYTLGHMYLSSNALATVITFKELREKHPLDIHNQCKEAIHKILRENGFKTHIMENTCLDEDAKIKFESGDIGVSADEAMLATIKELDRGYSKLRIIK